MQSRGRSSGFTYLRAQRDDRLHEAELAQALGERSARCGAEGRCRCYYWRGGPPEGPA